MDRVRGRRRLDVLSHTLALALSYAYLTGFGLICWAYHEQVPHVHFHVIPRTDGDGGKSMLSMWPNAPPMGSVQPDFAALGDLAAKLQAA